MRPDGFAFLQTLAQRLRVQPLELETAAAGNPRLELVEVPGSGKWRLVAVHGCGVFRGSAAATSTAVRWTQTCCTRAGSAASS